MDPRAEAGNPIPVVLSIDLEPDGFGHLLGDGGTWLGAAASWAWVEQLRTLVGDRTGRPARVSWLVRCDPQVEEVFGSPTHLMDTEPELFAAAAERGDEIGLHIHAWRRRPDGEWVDDFGDPAWFEECIDRSFAAFAGAFGRPCRLTRMGTRLLSPTAIARLVHHGVAVDMTGEPANGPVPDGEWDHLTGDVPDFRRMPRRPHRLAGDVVELPLTAGRKRLGWNVRAHLSRMRRHGLRERLDHPFHVGGKDTPGVTFAELVGDALGALAPRPFLNFAIRSDGLLDPVQRPRLLGRTDELLAMAQADRFRFTTPTEAVEALGVG